MTLKSKKVLESNHNKKKNIIRSKQRGGSKYTIVGHEKKNYPKDKNKSDLTTSEGYFSQPRAYIPNPGGGAFATFTYSVWCYPTYLSGYQSIIDQDNDDFLFCFAGSGSLMIYDPNNTVPGFTASTNKWYNLVVTHTQGSSFTFYINGVSTYDTGSNDSTTHDFDNWSFGAGNVTSDSNGDSEEFDGYMSSILIYNRALTAAEVTQNYNATKGRYGY